MIETQTKTLKNIRGRVPAYEAAELVGPYFVYWGVPSQGEGHRVAVLHLMRENGNPECQYVSGDTELIVFPEEMRPGIRWYKACRTCAGSIN